MAAISVEEHVKTLLERNVAEPHTDGVSNPHIEAQALFETLFTNIVLRPRTALLVALRSRNGLLRVVQESIQAVDVLKKTISDLSNTTFVIRDTTHLRNARTALQQVEALDRVSVDNPAFQRFSRSIDRFLEEQVATSVRTPGVPELKRPSNEALEQLPLDLETLRNSHSDLLDRLYALSVGVDNFLAAPFSTVLGLSTAIRAGDDIESLLDGLETSPETQSARDIAVRLITGRAAVRALSAPPDPFEPCISSSLPAGHRLRARSANAKVRVVSSEGPFSLASDEELEVGDGTMTVGPTLFPHSSALNNQACIVSEELSFPVTVPAGYYLFLEVDDVPYKLGPLVDGLISLNDVLTDLNGLFSAESLDLVAEEFCTTGTSRLIIRSPTATKISVAIAYTDGSAFYTNSIHEALGFETGQVGEANTTDIDLIVYAFNTLFSSVATAARDGNTVVIESVKDTPGLELTISMASTIGLAGTFRAESNQLILYGTVNGESVDPVDPRTLVDVGDEVLIDTGRSRISSLTSEAITLEEALETTDGQIRVESALLKPYRALMFKLDGFLRDWGTSKFSENLTSLDLAIAPLRASPAPAQTAAAVGMLNTLRGHLVSLRGILEHVDTQVPANSASREIEVLSGILDSLSERKFDRAIEMLMRCKILELLELTYETASYGGTLIKSLSDIAQNDIAFPNRSLDEEMENVQTDSGSA